MIEEEGQAPLFLFSMSEVVKTSTTSKMSSNQGYVMSNFCYPSHYFTVELHLLERHHLKMAIKTTS